MNPRGFSNMFLSGAVILIVIIGAAGYLLWSNKLKPVAMPILGETADWKTYRNERYEFEYPAIISLKQDGKNITLNHSIAHKHDNPCDFKGDASALEKLLDFNVSLTTFSGGLKDAIQSNLGSDFVKNFFENNTLRLTTGYVDSFTVGSLKGFEVINVFEGCGENVYYFPISPTETLIISRSLITEFILNSEAYLNFPGIIPPNQEEEFFTKILSTFKFTEKVDTADWKTYSNDKYGFEFKYPLDWMLKLGIAPNVSGSIMYEFIPISTITNGPVFIISQNEYSSLADLQIAYHANQSGETSPYQKSYKEKQVLIGDNLWWKIDRVIGSLQGDRNSTFYWVFHGSNTFFIFDSDPATIKILSTFKFIENNAGNSAVNITDLLGYWFTPHAATRNIIFLENNQFKFNDGKNPTYTGNFIINASTVTLKFDNNKMKDIILKLLQDNSAKYLRNDVGEYFVKQ